MRNSTQPSIVGRLLIPAVLGAAALGACSDQQPAAVRDPQLPPPATALQAFDCTGSTAGTVSCKPQGRGTPARAAGVLIGGQNV
jgi:hypothetical protein